MDPLPILERRFVLLTSASEEDIFAVHSMTTKCCRIERKNRVIPNIEWLREVKLHHRLAAHPGTAETKLLSSLAYAYCLSSSAENAVHLVYYVAVGILIFRQQQSSSTTYLSTTHSVPMRGFRARQLQPLVIAEGEGGSTCQSAGERVCDIVGAFVGFARTDKYRVIRVLLLPLYFVDELQ